MGCICEQEQAAGVRLQERNHGGRGLPRGPGVWTGFAGPEMFSPGPLSAETTGHTLGGMTSHAQTGGACDVCHTEPWSSQNMASRCMRCHADVSTEIQTREGVHGLLLGKTAIAHVSRMPQRAPRPRRGSDRARRREVPTRANRLLTRQPSAHHQRSGLHLPRLPRHQPHPLRPSGLCEMPRFDRREIHDLAPGVVWCRTACCATKAPVLMAPTSTTTSSPSS